MFGAVLVDAIVVDNAAGDAAPAGENRGIVAVALQQATIESSCRLQSNALHPSAFSSASGYPHEDDHQSVLG